MTHTSRIGELLWCWACVKSLELVPYHDLWCLIFFLTKLVTIFVFNADVKSLDNFSHRLLNKGIPSNLHLKNLILTIYKPPRYSNHYIIDLSF